MTSPKWSLSSGRQDTSDSDSFSESSRPAKLSIFGFTAAVMTGTILLIAKQLLVDLSVPFTRVWLFSMPTTSIEIPFFPPFGPEGFDVGLWLRNLLAGVFALLTVGVYYFMLAVFATGLLLFFGGLLLSRSPSEIVAAVRAVLADRRVQFAAAWIGFVWLVFLTPGVLALVVEIGIVLVVGGTVFVLSGLGVLALYDRTSTLVHVLVVYPLGAMTFVLSPIAAAFASPTFGRFMDSVTRTVIVWLLANVFALVGLDTVLSRVFDLRGVGFLLFWVAVVVVLGWVAGALRYFAAEYGWDKRIKRLG